MCACKKGCPLYKWRQRRREPPVGVIVAEPNELYRDDTVNLLNETEDTGIIFTLLLYGTINFSVIFGLCRRSNTLDFTLCEHPYLKKHVTCVLIMKTPQL